MSSVEQPNYGIVLVTTPSQAIAQAIAATLVEERLAACVSIFPIQSIYRWQGEIQQEPEYQLVIKTNLDYFDVLSAKIQESHSYEVPEVIALPITAGSQPYLAWLGSNIITEVGVSLNIIDK